MALVVVELETLVSEPDALTTTSVVLNQFKDELYLFIICLFLHLVSQKYACGW